MKLLSKGQWAQQRTPLVHKSLLLPSLMPLGDPPNSFLCHQSRGHGYAICDPRFVSKQPSVPSGHPNSASQRTESVGSASSIESSEVAFNTFEHPPPVCAFKRSPQGKNKIQKFNYSAFNVCRPFLPCPFPNFYPS
jgi:hypothetical protein